MFEVKSTQYMNTDSLYHNSYITLFKVMRVQSVVWGVMEWKYDITLYEYEWECMRWDNEIMGTVLGYRDFNHKYKTVRTPSYFSREFLNWLDGVCVFDPPPPISRTLGWNSTNANDGMVRSFELLPGIEWRCRGILALVLHHLFIFLRYPIY